MGLLDFLGLAKVSSAGGSSEVDSIRKIARQLEVMDRKQAQFLAAFAYLLGRVAQSDLEVSDVECERMERIVTEKGGLSPEQAVMTVELAKRQNLLFGHVENFLVAREFNEIATREQKLDLLDCLFSVAAADGSIGNREDREIRQIASELLLEHRDFIDVRSRYRDFLEVLKLDEA